MFPTFSISSRRAAVLLAAATVLPLTACQTAPDADTTAIEDAKKRKVIYRLIDGAPPRDIADIRAALAQAKESPEVPEAAAKVAQQPPSTDDNRALARFYWERGRAAGELGMDRLELDDLRRAAGHAKGLDTRDVEEDRIVSELGAAEYRFGNLARSAELRARAIEISRKRPGGGGGLTLSNYRFLVEIYSRLGERDKARATLATAESWLMELRNRRVYSWFQYNWPNFVADARAILLEDEGRYAEAEPLRRQIVADRRKDIEVNKERLEKGISNIAQLIPQRLASRAQRELAFNLLKQQRLLEAEALLRKKVQRTLHNRGRYFIGTGVDFRALSEVLYEQGRNSEARETAEVALEIFAKLGLRAESLYVTDAHRARAAALTAEGRYRDALAELERMKQALATDPRLAARLGRGDLDWTLALMRTGQAKSAIAMSEELLKDVRVRLGDGNYETAEVLGFLAMAQAAGGEREAALKNFAAAMPVLIAGSETTSGAQRSAVRVRRLVQITEAYIAQLAEAQANGLAKTLGIDPVGEAFRLADLARGSSVLRALSSSAARSAATDPKLAELVRREQDTSQRITATQDLIAGLVSAPPGQRSDEALNRLRDEVKTLTRERRELYATITKDFPKFAELLSPKPATIERVQASLASDEVMVATYVSSDRTYVWAVPRQGAVAFASAPLGEAAVADFVARLRKSVDSSASTLGAMPAFDVVSGHKLYEALLKPVESAWKDGDTLLVVPHRALAQLPLAMLPTAAVALKPDQKVLFENYRAVPWLVRKVAMVQLPTANAAITLRALPPGDPSRRAFAGFGDPLFNAEQAAGESKPAQIASRGLATRNLPLPRRNLKVARVSAETGSDDATAASDVANSSTLAQVPRLPDTAEEIREIAQTLKADEAQDVFLQLRATEGNVLNTPLADRRVIVFATHGLIPGELNGLNQPALALTAPALSKESGDGLLTMEEVLRLKLNADWVVLSACNTAAGEGKGGEAISGLGRAFFYAGTRAMLVTQWPVETSSARVLTTTVFRQQAAKAELTRAQALRETMLAMIDGPGHVDPASGKSVFAYAHPLFWAPYALVGDGGR